MLNFQVKNKLHFGTDWQLLNVFKAKLGIHLIRVCTTSNPDLAIIFFFD